MNTDYQLIAQLVGRYPLLDFLAVFLARYLPYVVVLVFVLVLFLMHSRYERLKISLFWIFSMILTSGIIGPLIHHFFFRPRPFVVYDTLPLITMDPAMASFPSSHTIFFFTLATVIFFGLSRKWGGWLFVIATFIGLARVYVGVHFLLDILGGAVIGFLVPLIVWLIFDKFWRREVPVDAPDVELAD
ncbi:MAG: hypothetical protein COU10_01480 [Candidatus Harrisonbacteria bacterium CG10_big_fil_rev_8_21_14_0_10_45_28]|uniref:Phosphatidic acid phosphatase type 2/haloperoxidase domain-containing protein n=1 Tax=Candidatus Harrisonbacteria bacterium CG10_big_fil_rev_8_21_14_0_10_45_28 TaxID=1974586 RepID=A0A2H0UQS2_9BACT|nr:MAG: hypothetical protein COU10_01480 [Candidatus Harrisonbacteria bacterium CG10_big_fil_rev_8_21_14_0_10_45_28]